MAYNTEMISNTFTANAGIAGITGIETHRHLGEKRYEIKDHLGNVRATVSDIKNAENYSLSASSWKFLADVRSLGNYYPYGSAISAGSWSGSSYNFGYNGMLKEGIGDDIYHTHFRNLSDGRWWSPDPKPNVSVSPYASMELNPIRYIDPMGDTIFVDKYGGIDTVQADSDGKLIDNFVYLRNGNEIEKLGEIGKEIDISKIFNNIKGKNAKESKEALLGMGAWAYNVFPGNKWDYKDNTNTIFGFAWNEDKKNNSEKKQADETHTIFNTGNYKMNASDFGNYNAGFTGVYSNYRLGIPLIMQWYGAGVFETIKDFKNDEMDDVRMQVFQMQFLLPPFGDEIDDFYWNTRGMLDAKKRIKYNREYLIK